MRILRFLYTIFLDSIFPLSKAEKVIFALPPEKAYLDFPRAPRSPVQNTHSVFAYKDECVTKLIWNIKYKKVSHSIAIGGYALYQELKNSAVNAGKSHGDFPLIVIPMPITQRRRNERGFNQCELLTDEIGRLDTKHLFSIRTDMLERVHHTSRQTLKDREERLESAKGVFEMNEKMLEKLKDSGWKEGSLKNTMVVMVDDVITTGSTMQEAMETIRKAGFKNVFGLSLAH